MNGRSEVPRDAAPASETDPETDPAEALADRATAENDPSAASSSPALEPRKLDQAFSETITDDLVADAAEGLKLTRPLDGPPEEPEGISLDDISGDLPTPPA